jgi:hypothetical protein
MDEGSPPAPAGPWPGPIRCQRCGLDWGGDAAFLLARSPGPDGARPWVCVGCAAETDDPGGPGPVGTEPVGPGPDAQSAENTG